MRIWIVLRFVLFTFITLLLGCCVYVYLKSAVKKLDATAGVVYYPYHTSRATINASREMYNDWGWKCRNEEGSNSDLTVSATDLNGKTVSINFETRLLHSRATIITEGGSEFTRSEIATELASRIKAPTEESRRNSAPSMALVSIAYLGITAWSLRRT